MARLDRAQAQSSEADVWRHSATTVLSSPPAFMARAAAVLLKYRWLLPLVSFIAGWAGFFLVQRGDSLAKVPAVLVLSGWIWLYIQPCMQHGVERVASSYWRSQGFILLAQSIQQQVLFFSLPFLLLATSGADPGQLLVTASVVIAAGVSTVDSLYQRYIAGRQLLRLGFHSLCSFVAALVVLPIVVRIPVESSFRIAMSFVVLWLLLATPFMYSKKRQFSLGLLLLALVFPVLVWSVRAHIPAAGIRVESVVLTSAEHRHDAGDNLKTVTVAMLERGLYAHAAISAPRGLSQQVYFEWRHGDIVDVMPVMVEGGGSEGFHTYAWKRHFGTTPAGAWQVDIRTPQGQLLERMAFDVVESSSGLAKAAATAVLSRSSVSGLAMKPAMKLGSSARAGVSIPLSTR